ncbi:hypothetical protein DQ806_15985 [Salmonella enterica subsp. enterica serovar Okatie]|nr:hypothetical protein [Salmonella enterica subsp. enterica serovar Okatie]
MWLKTKITAKLNHYPNSTSMFDAIFTVITSPDTDKAQYWGYMPETVTTSTGVNVASPAIGRRDAFRQLCLKQERATSASKRVMVVVQVPF